MKSHTVACPLEALDAELNCFKVTPKNCGHVNFETGFTFDIFSQ